MPSWGYEAEIHNVGLLVKIKRIDIRNKLINGDKKRKRDDENLFIELNPAIEIGPTETLETEGLLRCADILYAYLMTNRTADYTPKEVPRNFHASLYSCQIAYELIDPVGGGIVSYFLSADHGTPRIQSTPICERLLIPEIVSAPWPEGDIALGERADYFIQSITRLMTMFFKRQQPRFTASRFQIDEISNHFKKEIYFHADVEFLYSDRLIPYKRRKQSDDLVRSQLNPFVALQTTGAVDLSHFCPLQVGQIDPLRQLIQLRQGQEEVRIASDRILHTARDLPISVCNFLMGDGTPYVNATYRSLGPLRIGAFAFARHSVLTLCTGPIAPGHAKNFWQLFPKSSVLTVIGANLYNPSPAAFRDFLQTNSPEIFHNISTMRSQEIANRVRTYYARMTGKDIIEAHELPELSPAELLAGLLCACMTSDIYESFNKIQILSIINANEARLELLKKWAINCFKLERLSVGAGPVGIGRLKMEVRSMARINSPAIGAEIHVADLINSAHYWFEAGRNRWLAGLPAAASSPGAVVTAPPPLLGDPDSIATASFGSASEAIKHQKVFPRPGKIPYSETGVKRGSKQRARTASMDIAEVVPETLHARLRSDEVINKDCQACHRHGQYHLEESP